MTIEAKGLISIFALPEEVDQLQNTLVMLQRNISLLPPTVKFSLDVTLCLSDELTDWENSTLSPEYFKLRLHSMLSLAGWAENLYVNEDESVLGCVSQRRHSLKYVDDYDFTVWVDTDVFFNDRTFMNLVGSYLAAKANGHNNVIITPQVVRLWDDTWDILVHPEYKNHPIGYYKFANIHRDANIDYGEVTIQALPTFKFGGGLCTLFSNSVLKFIGIPESLGHYGLEDTFIMEICNVLRKLEHPFAPLEFVMENHIVGEIYNINLKLSDKLVRSRNRRDEFKRIAHENFFPEINNFLLNKLQPTVQNA